MRKSAKMLKKNWGFHIVGGITCIGQKSVCILYAGFLLEQQKGGYWETYHNYIE